MPEMLAHPFMQRALIAGVLTAMTAAYYGVFIVQRGMSFLGSGLAHAAFGGVALALLLGREPLWVAIPFTVATALLITWVRDRTNLGADTVIGVFFATAMALGIIFLSRVPTYSTDAFTYLFGSLLSVGRLDVWATAVMAGIALASTAVWGRWAYATIDKEAALADRLPVKFDNYLLSVLTAVTIVVAAKVVGVVLLSAFLVIPAAAARLVSRKFLQMTVISVIIGVVSAVTGLLASYALDTPSGATIILTQTTAFLGCFGVAGLVARHSRTTRAD